MKKLFSISLLLLTVFMLSFISAEDCYGMDASCPDGFDVNCYQTDSYVAWECVSDGSSTGYNIMPDGDSWCDSDEVIDYNKDSCCPDNFPYLDNNLCYQSPSLDSNAKNYFTELFKCEPSSKKCDNKEQFLCVNSDNRDSDNIYIRETYYWQGIGKRIGVCDYQECYASDVKCVGFDYYVCENNKWLNTGKVNTKCNVECTDDSNCKADIFVVSYCENGQNKTNLLDYYCNETSFSCDKKSNVIADEFKVDVCGIECLEDTDCNLDYVNETCDGLDSVLRYTDNYCSENKCLINITEDKWLEVGNHGYALELLDKKKT